MNFEKYREEIDRASFSPDFQQRVLRKLEAAQQEGKENQIMKKTQRSVRTTLIAAAVAALVCISAAAVAIITTAQHKALEDLGMDGDGTVDEYTAYDDENAPKNANNDVKLVSTVCTGTNMDAFFLVSPVSEQAALSIQNGGEHYYWDIGTIDTKRKNATVLVAQVDYDTGSNAALVRVTVMSEALTELDSINIPLILTCDEETICFGGVDVPVTESKLLTGTADLSLSCGKVTSVTVGATLIEVSIKAEPITASDTDGLHTACQAQRRAIEDALGDATVQFADGTSLSIAEIRSPFASEWFPKDGDLSAMEAGAFSMQHICSTVLDTTQIVSVTIAGAVIPVK